MGAPVVVIEVGADVDGAAVLPLPLPLVDVAVGALEEAAVGERVVVLLPLPLQSVPPCFAQSFLSFGPKRLLESYA